jgi:hypothetical protein
MPDRAMYAQKLACSLACHQVGRDEGVADVNSCTYVVVMCKATEWCAHLDVSLTVRSREKLPCTNYKCTRVLVSAHRPTPPVPANE